MTVRNIVRSTPIFIAGICGLTTAISGCASDASGKTAQEQIGATNGTDGGEQSQGGSTGGAASTTGGSNNAGGSSAGGAQQLFGGAPSTGGSSTNTGGSNAGGLPSSTGGVENAGGTTGGTGGVENTGGTKASTGGTTEGTAGTAAAGGKTAGTGGTTSGAGGSTSSTALVNPAPGSGLFLGVNFWNIGWEPADDFFVPNTNFKTTTNPWQPQLITDLKPFHVIRYMDWNLTNFANNPNAVWATRKLPTDPQDDSVALEWQIDLCNRTHTDYWLNIPHEATADTWAKIAQLVHDKLDPSLRVYVEWSNEVWNGGFPQAAYSAQQGTALGLAGAYPAWSYQAYESVRVWETFESVFGKNSPRVVKVIAGQMANSGVCDDLMTALKDPKINPNKTMPTAYAGAPYFQSTTTAGMPAAISDTEQWTKDSIECASGESLPVISYEGGQDSFAAGDCTSVQQDPAMRGLYKSFLDGQKAAGLKGPFMQYTEVGSCWGLKVTTSDTLANSPKYEGVLDWLAE